MITFKNVSLGYGNNTILEQLNFNINKNDFIGIIGQNGSGKTTILKAITGTIKPKKGKIICNSDIQLGYVIQRQYLDTIYPFSVKDITLMGRYGKIGVLRFPTRKDEQKVDEILELTGISHLKNKLYRELSGGQRQRVLIARALVSEPNVLLLDEPTNDLDLKGEEQILKLVQNIHTKFGITVILVSHTLLTVLNYVHKIIFLKDKKLEAYSLDEVFSEAMLTKIYDYPVKIGIIHNKKYVVPEEIEENGNT